MTTNKWNILALSAIFSLTAATAAPPVSSYKLNLVVKAGDVIDGKILNTIYSAAFNDKGEVVFGGCFNPTCDSTLIATPSHILVKRGDTIKGKTLQVVGSPSINNHGTVAFYGCVDVFCVSGTSTGIFTLTGPLVQSGDSLSGVTMTDFGPPVINDHGDIAYRGGGTVPGGFARGMFSQSKALVKFGDLIDGKQLFPPMSDPVIDDHGNVAFIGYDGTYSVDSQSHRLAGQGTMIAGKKLTGVFFSNPPEINGKGEIVFDASYEGSGSNSGIFTSKELLIKGGETIGGKTITAGNRPAINDGGDIAFIGFYNGFSTRAIFTPSALVLSEGDMVAGKQVQNVNRPRINKDGTILIAVYFTDNTTGIILAEPVHGKH